MNQRLSNIILLIFFIAAAKLLQAQHAEQRPYAHAHNDYAKLFRADLWPAINAGCASIEIDVFPKNGKLKVAHIPLFLGFRRDLEARYFRPLSNFLHRNDGLLYSQSKGNKARLILMIDIKRDAPEAYRQLRLLAEKYQDIFSCWYLQSDSVTKGPVELLLSGAKPYQEVLNDSLRYMRIDGGLGQIGDTIYTAKIAPRVSSSYRSHFKWRGRGEMPAKELEKLRDMVRRAHADGRQIRFWAMPNKLKVWQLFLKEGVDWLNVDNLRLLKKLKM